MLQIMPENRRYSIGINTIKDIIYVMDESVLISVSGRGQAWC